MSYVNFGIAIGCTLQFQIHDSQPLYSTSYTLTAIQVNNQTAEF